MTQVKKLEKLHLPHASRLHHSPHTKPPSLPLTHTPASISRHLPPASTLRLPYGGLHGYSTRRAPQLLHIPHRGTAHTYSLSRLTASTPHESASTCRPSHVVLPTQLDLFILTVTFSLFNFLITLSLFCILGFV